MASIQPTRQKMKAFLVKYIAEWGVYVFVGMVLFALMIGSVIPKNLDIHLHDVAGQDIQSPIDAVDTHATQMKKQEAIESTPSEYVYDDNLALIQVDKAGDLFDTISTVRQEEGITADSSDKELDDAVDEISRRLADSPDSHFSDRTLKTLLTADDLGIAEEITSANIYEAMSDKIGWDDLQEVQDKAVSSLPSSVLNDEMRQALTEVLRSYITANNTFDADATKQSREEAANNVDNVMIHQGEVIVRQGELVTNDMIRQLKLVGLLDEHFNLIPFAGLFLFVLFIVSVFYLEYQTYRKSPSRNLRGHATLKTLYMYALIFLGMVIILKVCSYLRLTDIPGLVYIVPVALGAMLIRVLISERLAIVTSLLTALTGSVIFAISTKAAIFDAPMGIYLLFSSLTGAMVIRGRQSRPKIIQTGSLIALVNMLIVLCLLMFQNRPFVLMDTGLSLGFALLSGFFSTILAIGLMPLFEAGFGILSPIRLIELSNPSHPLLRKILLEAPGTYHHSLMVANLAERACEVIGANGLLARVAAYYHDVGKTKRPRFFVENQVDGVNPHDKISPQLSRTIIISHPYDGAEILRQYQMPKEIIDIAEQHHGTTILRYFYAKAQERSSQPIPESDFRYPGPKVQTKEAAVVELADSIEAAVRSMKKPTPVKVENLVKSIFNDRVGDGQFDECDITMSELKKVENSIDETLRGVFHSRIEYPKELKMKKVN